MNTNSNKFYHCLFSISFIIFTMIMSFIIVCLLNKNLLYTLVCKYNTKQYLPFVITENEVKTICDELIEYLSGKRLFLNTEVLINGVKQNFYSIRSSVHMSDVKNLFSMARNVMLVFMTICIFTLSRLTKNQNHNTIVVLYKVWKKTLLAFSTILTAIVIFALINFDAFFTCFHKMLFTNDLWLLDPYTDYIICLLPEIIFINYGIFIIITFLLIILVFTLVIHFLTKIPQSPEAK